MNFQMFKLVLEKAEEPEIKCNRCQGQHKDGEEFSPVPWRKKASLSLDYFSHGTSLLFLKGKGYSKRKKKKCW